MSIVIKKCMGRYGNQMCLYFVGRILSENLKFKLYGPCESDRDFALRGIDLNYNNELHQSYEHPIQQLGDHSRGDEFSHPDFNILDIIRDNTPRKIIIDGYCQRKNFFLPFRDSIIKWFNVTPYATDKNDVAVHIRLGDLASPRNNKHMLPFEYYEKAIQNFNFKKLTLCTDSPCHSFIAHIVKKYNATIFNGDEKDTISFLAAHNNLILSQGTFSFWSGFLCNGENIINAIPKTGWNSSEDSKDIDLLIQSPRNKYYKIE